MKVTTFVPLLWMLTAGSLNASAQQSASSPPVVSTQSPKRIKLERDVARVVHKEEPVYPPLAMQSRIEGDISLEIVVGADGIVKDVVLSSGPSILAPAAIEAARKWRFEPIQVAGEPVEFLTTITVSFILPDGNLAFEARLGAADPARLAAARKFIVLMETKKSALQAANQTWEKLRPAIVQNFPENSPREAIVDALLNKYRALLDSPAFVDRLALLYAERFSLDELETLIQFCESPIGRKLFSEMPAMVEEQGRMTEAWMNQERPRILSELIKEFPQLQQPPLRQRKTEPLNDLSARFRFPEILRLHAHPSDFSSQSHFQGFNCRHASRRLTVLPPRLASP